MLRDLIKRMPKKRLGSRRARERHLRRVGHHRELSSGLQFESLEQRALLAGLTVAGIDGITNVIEGGTLTFEVKLDGAVPDAFTVDVTLAEVTATGGVAPLVYPQDYDNVVAQLYFSGTAGETQQFTVATLDDAVVELDETFSISLTASDVLIDGSATATGTIIDNDHATLSVGNATIVEGDAGTKMLSFPVTLDAAVDVDVSVDYTTQDGTASAADGDYVAVTTPATLTISAGDTSGTINISVNGDTTVELSETLSVVLDNPQCDGCAVTLTLTDWSQLGQSIYGEQFWNDRFGESVSVSGDGDTIVVGAPGASSIADRNGRARVYHFDDAEWTQLGGDFDGDNGYDYSAGSVAVSSRGDTVAIGATGATAFDVHGVHSEVGQTRVFRYNGAGWTQLGEDINGEFQQDYSGESVSLSGDGNTVAIGARYNDGAGENSGHVRVFQFDGTYWLQLGPDIDGEAVSDQSGGSVSLSSDGHTLVIGAPRNDGNGSLSGHARVYRFDGTNWVQLGGDLDGESSFDWFGVSVAMSSDGDTVAIGGHLNDDNGFDSGQVRVFRYDGGNWTQLGQNIDGHAPGELAGYSVSLSNDGNTMAVGAPKNDNSSPGIARFYRFDGITWIQLGQDIVGDTLDDEFGFSVAISGDGATMVVGAPIGYSHFGGVAQARIFQLQAKATGTIINDDRAITVEDVSAVEGRSLTFTVTLNDAVQGPFTVDVVLDDVTATGGTTPLVYPNGYYNNRTSSVAQLNFSGTAGEAKQFTVRTLNDRIVEATEEF